MAKFEFTSRPRKTNSNEPLTYDITGPQPTQKAGLGSALFLSLPINIGVLGGTDNPHQSRPAARAAPEAPRGRVSRDRSRL